MKDFHRSQRFFEEQLERRGQVNERFALGEVRTGDPAYRMALDKMRAGIKHGRPTFEEELQLIKPFQPFVPDSFKIQDPSAPIKQFPRDLLRNLQQKLGLKDAKQLRYFTAVGSNLDHNFKT